MFELQVAHVVALGVIECLEMVQINEQQGTSRAAAAASRDGLLEPFCQQDPVGQAGELVIESQCVNFLLGRLALGHVAQGTGKKLALIVFDATQAHLYIAFTTIFTQCFGAHSDCHSAGCRGGGKTFAQFRMATTGTLGYQFFNRLANQLL